MAYPPPSPRLEGFQMDVISNIINKLETMTNSLFKLYEFTKKCAPTISTLDDNLVMWPTLVTTNNVAYTVDIPTSLP